MQCCDWINAQTNKQTKTKTKIVLVELRLSLDDVHLLTIIFESDIYCPVCRPNIASLLQKSRVGYLTERSK